MKLVIPTVITIYMIVGNTNYHIYTNMTLKGNTNYHIYTNMTKGNTNYHIYTTSWYISHIY